MEIIIISREKKDKEIKRAKVCFEVDDRRYIGFMIFNFAGLMVLPLKMSKRNSNWLYYSEYFEEDFKEFSERTAPYYSELDGIVILFKDNDLEVYEAYTIPEFKGYNYDMRILNEKREYVGKVIWRSWAYWIIGRLFIDRRKLRRLA